MDCEHVFARLTAAPFPGGDAADAAVEAHLSVCPNCHRFAEALRPDDRQGHEALSTRERTALPSYSPAHESVPAVARRGGFGGARSAAASLGAGGLWGAAAPTPWVGPPSQVAAFTLCATPRRSGWWDAVSLAALMLAVAVGGWGLGLLAM